MFGRMHMTKTRTGQDGRSGAAQALRSLFRKGDIILLLVLLVAVALSVWFALRPGGEEAKVYVDGELRYTFSLSQDGEYDILDGRMTIGVSGGRVSVLRSDCSEQLCVHSAAQSVSGGLIVCLPNHVVIEVGEREVDAIT